jgi:hypothetical protein
MVKVIYAGWGAFNWESSGLLHPSPASCPEALFRRWIATDLKEARLELAHEEGVAPTPLPVCLAVSSVKASVGSLPPPKTLIVRFF